MNNKPYLDAGRLFFGLLGLSAIVTEIAVLVERGSFAPFHFFSYFTILSNLAAGLFLVLYSRSTKRKPTQQRAVDLIRGAITLYMGMTGVIFAVLLANIEGATLTAVPWDNIVLHYIMPIIIVFDWLLNPPKNSIAFKQSLVWLLFPLAYVTYSLVRGSMVSWYPYPFLSPTEYGYGQVFITSAIMLAGIIGVIWLLIQRAGARQR